MTWLAFSIVFQSLIARYRTVDIDLIVVRIKDFHI